MKVNTNDTVKVKLTPIGIDIINKEKEKFKEYGCLTDFIFIPDEEGYTTFELWEFMNIFGKYFHIGLDIKDSPIEFNFEIMEH